MTVWLVDKRMRGKKNFFSLYTSLRDLTQGLDHLCHFYDAKSMYLPMLEFFLNARPFGHLYLDVT